MYYLLKAKYLLGENSIIEKKNVLLVDDICDSSKTLEETIKYLQCL
jgi:hypoxanthine phosphoribosyltransferase